MLGTGTSQGVPVIGCTCAICCSPDPRDRRLRTSAWIQVKGLDLVIDCGPDFRQQMLRAGVPKLDALLLTHEHNDHVIGLDDIRPFNFMSRSDMPVFATPRVQKEIRDRFPYIFDEINRYPGAPGVINQPIDPAQAFSLGEVKIQPVEVMHGVMPVLGFRIGKMAYITDMRTISDASFEKLAGVEVLIINALHFHPHSTHMNVEEALAFVERLAPRQTYLTHISHRMGLHEEINKILPSGVALGYDGLQVQIR